MASAGSAATATADITAAGSMTGHNRVLDPVERMAEVLFGLIMVLTFTSSISVATSGRPEIREMLRGALGCNVAWGVVDAVMYVMVSALNRGRGWIVVKAIREARDASDAHAFISEMVNPYVASLLRPAAFAALRDDLKASALPPARPVVTRQDLIGAVAVFLLVFLSTFPVAIPFLVIEDVATAMRVSNAVAVFMLGALGYVLGRHSGMRPLVLALAMSTIGVTLVAITIALGG